MSERSDAFASKAKELGVEIAEDVLKNLDSVLVDPAKTDEFMIEMLKKKREANAEAQGLKNQVKTLQDAETTRQKKALEDAGNHEELKKLAEKERDDAIKVKQDLEANLEATKVTYAFLFKQTEKIPEEFVKLYVPVSADEKALEVGWKQAKEKWDEALKKNKTYPIGSGDHGRRGADGNKPDFRSPTERLSDELAKKRLKTN